MKVTWIIAIALLAFSCKKEKPIHSHADGEYIKLVYSDVTSWEGLDSPLCEGGHPECGADYYLQFVIPKNAVTIQSFLIEDKAFSPESYIVPGHSNDTLKMQLHFYEHSSCNPVHPEFLMKNMTTQKIKIDYLVLGEEERRYERNVLVKHKEMRIAVQENGHHHIY